MFMHAMHARHAHPVAHIHCITLFLIPLRFVHWDENDKIVGHFEIYLIHFYVQR